METTEAGLKRKGTADQQLAEEGASSVKDAASSAAAVAKSDDLDSQQPKAKKRRASSASSEETNKSALDELKQAFANGVAQDVIYWMKDGTIIQLLATDSFYVALATLIDAKIRAAPIYDESEKKYIGFVDMLDLTAAVVELVEANDTFKNKKKQTHKSSAQEQGEQEASEESPEASNRRKRDYEEDEDDPFAEHLILESLSVKAIADFSHTDPFISLSTKDSLTRVAELLRDHHRIGVINEADRFVGLVTQTGFVEYMSEEHALTLDKLKLKISDLHLSKEVFTVPVEDTTALDALKMMRDKKVTGLGVVNKNGLLLDVISASDLMVWSEWEACGQPLRFRHLSSLNYPITEFLNNSRAQSHHKKVHRSEGPIVCHQDTELMDAIGLMLTNSIHRLFVVDELRKPISVLTYGDIIAHLTSAP